MAVTVAPNPSLDPVRNVCVAASAGTGKTWLLTARIVRLLLAGASAQGILALTFTRKAAAEIGQRVSERLRKLATADDAALDAQLSALGLIPNHALRQRARALYQAHVFADFPLRAQTLHAFCQDLVTRFALQCGVAPGAALVDNEAELLDDAWQELQRALLAQPQSVAAQALRELIDLGSSEREVREIVKGFLYLRNDWRAYADGRANALDALGSELRARLELEVHDPLAALELLPFTVALRTLAKSVSTFGGVNRVKPAPLVTATEQPPAQRYATLRATLFTQEHKPCAFVFSKKLHQAHAAAALDACLQAHGAVVSTLQRVDQALRRQHTFRRTRAGVTLGAAALAALEQILARRNLLPFAELEWHACRLLTAPATAAWVQYKLDQRVDHLLVDEFQDTSNTQWQLLLPLLQEMAAGEAGRARSAFFVGDVKQSIYGFRRANPELMPRAQSWLADNLSGVGDVLIGSRRSAPAVIDLINAVFAPAGMLPEFPAHTTYSSAWGRVELAPRIAPDADEADEATQALRDPLTQPRPDPENTRALREGRQIAQRIAELVQAHSAIDTADGPRALGYGDVMILLRARTHQQMLERALTEGGIPYVGAARGTLLETVEARDVMALLRFLSSPGRDLDLAHALRSPVFGASDEDLIALATYARGHECGWYQALIELPINPILQRAQALLTRWLPLARALPAHDLLDRICSEANIAARYESALPPIAAARVRANLAALLQFALAADSGRYPSLGKFLRQLERVAAHDAPDEAPPPASTEAGAGQVRILTIHAAKGLEAPAVFVAQTASMPRAQHGGWLVEWPHGDARPVLMLFAAGAGERDDLSESLVQQRGQRQAREDLNLLYVALTRARQFLHVSGFASKRGGSGSWYDAAARAFETLPATLEGERRVHLNGAPQAASPSMPPSAAPPVDPRLAQPLVLPLVPPRAAALNMPTVDAATAREGSAIHLLLQHLTHVPTPAEHTLRAQLEAAIPCTPKEFSSWLTQARSVVAAPALAQWFDPGRYARAWNEVPIVDGDAVWVIDRLVDDGATLWVLDYKTARDASPETLIAQYRAQLVSYRALVQRLWPERPVRSGLVLTANTQWVELA